MNFLVDSNLILDFFNGKTELFHFFDDTEKLYVSVVSVGELNYKARITKSDKDTVQIASDFCHLLHIVEIDEQIAKKYGELRIFYPDFEVNKLWLCATAIVRDFVIVSDDAVYEKVHEVVYKRPCTPPAKDCSCLL